MALTKAQYGQLKGSVQATTLQPPSEMWPPTGDGREISAEQSVGAPYAVWQGHQPWSPLHDNSHVWSRKAIFPGSVYDQELPRWLNVKNLHANAGDMDLIPESGRSPGDGNGNPLQYSCLGNPMNRGAWWATVHGIAKELDMAQQLNNNINDQSSQGQPSNMYFQAHN